MQIPSIGRIVHYVLSEGPNAGKARPAIIVEVWSNTCVNICLFTDGTNDGIEYNSLTNWKCSVIEGSIDVKGSWFWPPFVAPKEEGK